SPTICQRYIADIPVPIRQQATKAIILHYMDDVVVCAPNQSYLDTTIETVGFELQPEKVQKVSPCKYLGLKITECTITPQPLAINDNPRTLQELHQLCGSCNWVRPWLGITTEDLAPLFNFLRGSDELTSPRSLTEEAKISIQKAQEALTSRLAYRCCPNLP
ncbi:POK18 protein, partial [Climacteris rufus]|nr:POK18 protein [Climacteris rufus]